MAANAQALIGAAHAAYGRGEYAAAAHLALQAADALSGEPRSDVLNLAAACAWAQGDAVQACERWQLAVGAHSRNSQAMANWAGALDAAGDAAGAQALYERARRANPQDASAAYNFAVFLAHRGAVQEGLVHARDAVSLAPAWALAHFVLGSLLREAHALDAARAAFSQAARLDDHYADPHTGLGLVALEQGQLEQASAHLQAAYQRNPADGNALSKLDYSLRMQCDFDALDRLTPWLHDHIARVAKGQALTIAPFDALCMPLDAAQHRIVAQAYGAQQLASLSRSGAQHVVAMPRARAHSSVRVGWLSAEFHDHATMRLLADVLTAFEVPGVESWCYSYGEDRTDGVRARLKAHTTRFQDVRALNDADLASQIAADGIDVLVDLKGYTRNARLGVSALRPAPVIVSWLGYPGTLGVPGLADWIVGDEVVTPPGCEAHYSERILRLPWCYQPNPMLVDQELARRVDHGLKDDAIVLCNFNQHYKITRDVWESWGHLLSAHPQAVLWQLDPGALARANLMRAWQSLGIDPARVVWAPSLPHAQHLSRLALADLALDTFPVTSHTTASDLMAACVPVVVAPGDSFVSRVSASIVTACGLSDCVVASRAEQAARTHGLIADSSARAQLRERIAKGRTALFNPVRFAAQLRDALCALVSRD